jgi:hypothetical protein
MIVRPILSCLWLLVGLMLLPACLASAPRLRIEASQGIVRAESVPSGRLVAKLLDRLAPAVRARLPDTRTAPLEVWVQEQLSIYRGWPVNSDVPAFTVEGEGRIHVLETDDLELSVALAHELVHALLGPSWQTLQPVAEEGLADWMQERLNRRVASSLRADHLAKAGAAMGGLPLGVWAGRRFESGRQLLAFHFPEPLSTGEVLDPRETLDETSSSGSFFKPFQVAVSDPRHYGIGYLVVSRIIERQGILALHQLCKRAAEDGLDQIPAVWLLEASGLDCSTSCWLQVITERVGRYELRALARQLVPALVRRVTEELGPMCGATSGRDFLLLVDPEFGLVGGRYRVDLSDIPGFVQALLSAWPGPKLTDVRPTDGVLPVSWPASSRPASPRTPTEGRPAGLTSGRSSLFR